MFKRKKKSPVSRYRTADARRRNLLLAAGILLATGGIWGGILLLTPATPTADQAKAVLTTDEGLAELQALAPAERKARLTAYGKAISTDIGPGREGERGPRRPREDDPMRKNLEKLSPEDRSAFFQARGESFRAQREKQEDDKIRAFFKASPEEQAKLLAEDLARQKQREEERSKRQPPASAGTPTPAANGHKPGNNPPRNNWANVSRDKREERMRDRLDSTDPEMRALRSVYFTRLREAAKHAGTTASK